ncbi:MAG: peptide transporter permease [Verrucomicrobiaceae bacterium]|nr:peptide transporter permease [Verrucomicrobiaceae bacterium]
MRPMDLLQFSTQTLLRQRFRGLMILIAMGLGVAAVMILTALGQGARGYVMNEFAAIGTNVLAMFPGRQETTGGMPPPMGAAARDITIDEAFLLQRRVSSITAVAPLIVGSARVGYAERAREVSVLGTSALFFKIRHLTVGQGNALPDGDFRVASGEAVIGEKLKRELFEAKPAIGEFLRIGDSRFRVVGILTGRGDAMGMDLSDAVIIPVAASQRLFNAAGLFRVLIELREGTSAPDAIKRIEAAMQDFHQGELDVTVISPDSMRATFDGILIAMTLAVSAIGAISLFVAGILIMNVMLITVSQRTREIGLLKALGASSTDIMRIFLTEAMLLTGMGALVGVLFGFAVVKTARAFIPTVPFDAPGWAITAAVITALLTGLGFSWLPARRASLLQPVDALQKP